MRNGARSGGATSPRGIAAADGEPRLQAGQQVLGSDGSAVGVVGEVYVEDGGRVVWFDVGGVLVPADEVCLFEGVVHVPYGVHVLRAAPRVVRAGEISAVDALALNRHYGISARARTARSLG